MALHQIESGPEAGHRKRIEFRDDDTPETARAPLVYYSHDDDHLFITNAATTPKAFLALFNAVQRSVTEKAGKGLLPKRGELIEARISIQDRGAAGSAPAKTFGRLPTPLELDFILSAFGRNADHALHGIGINTPYFAMMFEGPSGSILSTPFHLTEEAGLFVQRAAVFKSRPEIVKASVKIAMDANPVRNPKVARLAEGVRADDNALA